MLDLAGIWENRRAVAYCIFVCLGATTFGFNVSLLLGFESFRVQFGNKYEGTYVVPAIYQSVWNSMSVPGGVIGSLCAGPIGNMLGRRFMFIIASFSLLSGALLQQLAMEWKVLATGRLFSFVGMSMYCVAIPTYVSEVAPPKIRGMLLAQISFFFLMGQFLTACVLNGTQKLSGNLQFRIPLILQYIVPGILFIFIWFFPEPPSWLVENHKLDAARASLVRLYGTTPDIEDRLLELRNASTLQTASGSPKAKYITCFKGSNVKRTIIAVGITLCQQFAGIAFIVAYSAYFFVLSGIPESQAFTVTSIMFALQLLANIISWYLIERFGRRVLLLAGMAVIIVLYLIIGGIGTSANYSSGTLPKVIVTCMVIVTVTSQLSISSVVWAIGGEVSSLELRASTQAIAIAFNSIVGLAFEFGIPYMLNPDQANLGPKIGFVFATLSVLAIMFIFFMVPEMKGRKFNELDYMFHNRVPIRKFQAFIVPHEVEVHEAKI